MIFASPGCYHSFRSPKRETGRKQEQQGLQHDGYVWSPEEASSLLLLVAKEQKQQSAAMFIF